MRGARSENSPRGIQKKIEFLVLWLVVLLISAGVVYFAVWSAASEFGSFRGGLLAIGIVAVIQLVIFGYLFEDAVDGKSAFDAHGQILSNVVGGIYETFHDLIAIKSFMDMDRPWIKAVAIGGILGILVSFATVVGPNMGKKAVPTTMVGQAMPNVDLPLAGGGDFRGEDLLGKTTVVLIRAKFGEAPHAFMDAWDASVADGTNSLDLMVLMMDQYGDVKPYEDGKYARYPYPIAVGRKWIREWFGNFKGDALVLVVAPDGSIVATYKESRLLRDKAPETLRGMIAKFADS
ncbi:MAG: hypothetical protein MK085_02315 [Phycisphaerales bacterium]|nr:hypothetical protein [Phycisphaerales bacterium]